MTTATTTKGESTLTNDKKCQFRLNAEEELEAGSMNFIECEKDATQVIVVPEPITHEVISLDLCDEHFQYMIEQEFGKEI